MGGSGRRSPLRTPENLPHDGAYLSTEPDGTLVSFESLKSGAVRYASGRNGLVEVTGSPDLALEVVSESSVTKDTEVLRRLYYRAGVEEYWLADGRGRRPSFDILVRGRGGFAAAPKRAGWIRSPLLGRSFRLTSAPDEPGYTDHDLETR